MKGKRILFMLVLGFILVIGWVTAITKLNHTKEKQAQTQLVAQGDDFVRRGLYIRGIPLYKEALQYNIESNEYAIEQHLLKAYLQYGDMVSYTNLVNDEVSRGRAETESIITTAQYNFDNYHFEEGMVLLEKAKKMYPESVDIFDMYEKYRFTYKIHSKPCEYIGVATFSLYPAISDGKYGYVTPTGSVAIPFHYDTATMFNPKGFAVVSKNGTYYTINANGDYYGVNDGEVKITDVTMLPADSVMIAKANGGYSYYNLDFIRLPAYKDIEYDYITGMSGNVSFVQKGTKWAIINSSAEQITDFVFDDVRINSIGNAFSGGLAVAKQDGKWYIINTEGNKEIPEGFDDAKAPESAGLIAVANSSGLWGYIDPYKPDKLAIDYKYYDAYSFSDNLGAVKLYDDTWNYVSANDLLVIDEILTYASPFHNGIATVGYSGASGIITLSYKN